MLFDREKTLSAAALSAGKANEKSTIYQKFRYYLYSNRFRFLLPLLRTYTFFPMVQVTNTDPIKVFNFFLKHFYIKLFGVTD